jgi:hypothetical protein
LKVMMIIMMMIKTIPLVYSIIECYLTGEDICRVHEAWESNTMFTIALTGPDLSYNMLHKTLCVCVCVYISTWVYIHTYINYV